MQVGWRPGTGTYIKTQTTLRQKRGVIKALVDRTQGICESDKVQKELQHLENVLARNGYSRPEIKRAMKPRRHYSDQNEPEPIVGKAFLSYIPKVTNRIGKLMDTTLRSYFARQKSASKTKISQVLHETPFRHQEAA